MKFRATSLTWYLRYMAAGMPGALAGAAVAGLTAVLTGQAFASDSAWLPAVPGLILVGVAAGALTARATRWWLMPERNHRTFAFAVAGMIAVPLATAVGTITSDALLTGVAALALAGGVITLTMYAQQPRKSARRHQRAATTAVPAR